ncbi:MAG: ABC transporter permease, partial [Ignavibacteria bacterium]
SLASFAFLSRQMRSSMLEVIRQDYIRTARAKGLSERKVVLKHALRNSLIPIITLVGGILPAMIGGSVIMETIFSIPGIGQLAFQAILDRDYPMIMAELVLASVLTVVGILLVDILYSFVDPRIAFTKKAA